MAPFSTFARTIIIVLAWTILGGCANFGWRTQPSSTPSPAKENLDDLSLKRPAPCPALFIPGTPSAELPSAGPHNWSDADRRSDTGVVKYQEAPAADRPLVRAVSRENPRPAEAELSLREIQRRACERFAGVNGYQMRLRRREVVSGKQRPEEIVLCKIRQEPFSVYLKWVGPEGNKREVVYVKGQFDNLIHTLTAAGDILFMPGGQHFKIAPDNSLVRSKSRYPITEAGIGPLIERFGRLVAAVEKGDPSEGDAQIIGRLKRPEFEHEMLAVRQTLPPAAEKHLPRRGQRLWFFSTVESVGLPAHIPVLIVTTDDTDKEVEYYCHDRFVLPLQFDDHDFNPDRLWAQSDRVTR